VTKEATARGERRPIRFATPYLEVEKLPISSLERTILRELAQASHAARREKGKGAGRVRRSRDRRLCT
jgi:hypothetical protein